MFLHNETDRPFGLTKGRQIAQTGFVMRQKLNPETLVSKV